MKQLAFLALIASMFLLAIEFAKCSANKPDPIDAQVDSARAEWHELDEPMKKTHIQWDKAILKGWDAVHNRNIELANYWLDSAHYYERILDSLAVIYEARYHRLDSLTTIQL